MPYGVLCSVSNSVGKSSTNVIYAATFTNSTSLGTISLNSIAGNFSYYKVSRTGGTQGSYTSTNQTLSTFTDPTALSNNIQYTYTITPYNVSNIAGTIFTNIINPNNAGNPGKIYTLMPVTGLNPTRADSSSSVSSVYINWINNGYSSLYLANTTKSGGNYTASGTAYNSTTNGSSDSSLTANTTYTYTFSTRNGDGYFAASSVCQITVNTYTWANCNTPTFTVASSSAVNILCSGAFSQVIITFSGGAASPGSGTTFTGTNSINQQFTSVSNSATYIFTCQPVNSVGYASSNTTSVTAVIATITAASFTSPTALLTLGIGIPSGNHTTYTVSRSGYVSGGINAGNAFSQSSLSNNTQYAYTINPYYNGVLGIPFTNIINPNNASTPGSIYTLATVTGLNPTRSDISSTVSTVYMTWTSTIGYSSVWIQNTTQGGAVFQGSGSYYNSNVNSSNDSSLATNTKYTYQFTTRNGDGYYVASSLCQTTVDTYTWASCNTPTYTTAYPSATILCTGTFTKLYITFSGGSASPGSGTTFTVTNSISQLFSSMSNSTYTFNCYPVNLIGYQSSNNTSVSITFSSFTSATFASPNALNSIYLNAPSGTYSSYVWARSGWTSGAIGANTAYTDTTSLANNTQYSYTITPSDSTGIGVPFTNIINPNNAGTPGKIYTLATVTGLNPIQPNNGDSSTDSTVYMTWTSTIGYSSVWIQNTTTGGAVFQGSASSYNSSSNYSNDNSLSANTSYTYQFTTRNGDGYYYATTLCQTSIVTQTWAKITSASFATPTTLLSITLNAPSGSYTNYTLARNGYTTGTIAVNTAYTDNNSTGPLNSYPLANNIQYNYSIRPYNTLGYPGNAFTSIYNPSSTNYNGYIYTLATVTGLNPTYNATNSTISTVYMNWINNGYNRVYLTNNSTGGGTSFDINTTSYNSNSNGSNDNALTINTKYTYTFTTRNGDGIYVASSLCQTTVDTWTWGGITSASFAIPSALNNITLNAPVGTYSNYIWARSGWTSGSIGYNTGSTDTTSLANNTQYYYTIIPLNPNGNPGTPFTSIYNPITNNYNSYIYTLATVTGLSPVRNDGSSTVNTIYIDWTNNGYSSVDLSNNSTGYGTKYNTTGTSYNSAWNGSNDNSLTPNTLYTYTFSTKNGDGYFIASSLCQTTVNTYTSAICNAVFFQWNGRNSGWFNAIGTFTSVSVYNNDGLFGTQTANAGNWTNYTGSVVDGAGNSWGQASTYWTGLTCGTPGATYDYHFTATITGANGQQSTTTQYITVSSPYAWNLSVSNGIYYSTQSYKYMLKFAGNGSIVCNTYSMDVTVLLVGGGGGGSHGGGGGAGFNGGYTGGGGGGFGYGARTLRNDPQTYTISIGGGGGPSSNSGGSASNGGSTSFSASNVFQSFTDTAYGGYGGGYGGSNDGKSGSGASTNLNGVAGLSYSGNNSSGTSSGNNYGGGGGGGAGGAGSNGNYYTTMGGRGGTGGQGYLFGGFYYGGGGAGGNQSPGSTYRGLGGLGGGADSAGGGLQTPNGGLNGYGGGGGSGATSNEGSSYGGNGAVILLWN